MRLTPFKRGRLSAYKFRKLSSMSEKQGFLEQLRFNSHRNKVKFLSGFDNGLKRHTLRLIAAEKNPCSTITDPIEGLHEV